MKFVDVEPNSPQWLEWRRDKLSASEAPIIADCAPTYWSVRTWQQLRLKKRGEFKEQNSEFSLRAQQHGQEVEKEARRVVLPEGYQPVCIETNDGEYAASLDAFKSDEQVVWAEIKSPYTKNRSSLWKHMESRCKDKNPKYSPPTAKDVIPEFIWWQLVHQSYVLFRDDYHSISKELQSVLIIYLYPNNYIEFSISVRELIKDWVELERMWQLFLSTSR